MGRTSEPPLSEYWGWLRSTQFGQPCGRSPVVAVVSGRFVGSLQVCGHCRDAWQAVAWRDRWVSVRPLPGAVLPHEQPQAGPASCPKPAPRGWSGVAVEARPDCPF